MLTLLVTLLLALRPATSAPSGKHGGPSIVSLGYASYRGTPLDTGVTQYLGMRFAAPPTDDLRWRAPTDPAAILGVQDATRFGAICVGVNQTATANVTEDCLFINVFAPSNATRSSRLPVWLYIQGGGYVTNSNSNYNGTDVIVDSGHNMVFVNFNYRVGAFGFLAGEKVKEDGDLNVGLLDQRKAMLWVKKYISEFGGDPDHIVIHGVSAGAGSVGTHLTAYGGRSDNLFIGAIVQSPFFPCHNTIADSEWQFDRYVSAAGCSSSADPMTCLRSQSFSVLQAANVASPFPNQTSAPLFYFTPVIDNDLIRGPPLLAFQNGNHINVPLLLGDETNEGSNFAANATSPSEVSSFFSANCPHLPPSALSTVDTLYPLMSPLPKHAAYFPSVSQAYSESTFICPGLVISKALADSGVGVWNYRFDVLAKENVEAGVGVPHTFDTAAIFGVDYAGTPSSKAVLSYETYNSGVVGLLMGYYISFVRDLNPDVLRAKNSPVWEGFDEDVERRLLVQGNGSMMETVPREQEERCGFWKGLVGVTGQ